MHTELQIIKLSDNCVGIRDRNGFLFFFPDVNRYPGQEERYEREMKEQEDLAEYLLAALQERSQPTPVAADASPVLCDECGIHVADYPSKNCQGCNAYKEHQAWL